MTHRKLVTSLVIVDIALAIIVVAVIADRIWRIEHRTHGEPMPYAIRLPSESMDSIADHRLRNPSGRQIEIPPHAGGVYLRSCDLQRWILAEPPGGQLPSSDSATPAYFASLSGRWNDVYLAGDLVVLRIRTSRDGVTITGLDAGGAPCQNGRMVEILNEGSTP